VGPRRRHPMPPLHWDCRHCIGTAATRTTRHCQVRGRGRGRAEELATAGTQSPPPPPHTHTHTTAPPHTPHAARVSRLPPAPASVLETGSENGGGKRAETANAHDVQWTGNERVDQTAVR
jgi:hypothetical protein